VELRACGRPREPHQDNQKANVRPRWLRPVAQARTARTLIPPRWDSPPAASVARVAAWPADAATIPGPETTTSYR
jgi:hypothetical protein